MQAIVGLFLIVVTATAIAQQYGTASHGSVLPDVQSSSSKESGPGAATSTAAAAGLPDAPSYATRKPASDSSIVPPEQAPRAIDNSAMGSGTTQLSPISRRYLNLSMPSRSPEAALIFGGSPNSVGAAGAHEREDGAAGSATNCARSLAEKTEANGNGWINSLLAMTSKGGHYCALGEGGFWKRGTYAMGRAFAAHRYDGSNSFYTSGLFNPASAGMPAGYNPYQDYTGERLAARYASAIGRDTLKNMFREFWPDISTHMLRRRP